MRTPATPPGRPARRRTKTMRRVSGGLALLFALIAVGFVYAALTPNPQTAAAADTNAAQVAAGKQLFDNSCITCHGANLEGVQGRGPSLIGVGEAAAYFQLSTGRMPATQNGAQMYSKRPFFTPEEIDQLAAYIQANGGGPQIPQNVSLRNDAELAKGGELYRLNCASCHNFTGQGGALSQGKFAPNLNQATDQEIYGAMLSGPENMPKFSDAQLTPNDKKAIIAFIQDTKATQDPGGYSMGGFGPVSEGLIGFVVGMGAIVALTMWFGSRA